MFGVIAWSGLDEARLGYMRVSSDGDRPRQRHRSSSLVAQRLARCRVGTVERVAGGTVGPGDGGEAAAVCGVAGPAARSMPAGLACRRCVARIWRLFAIAASLSSPLVSGPYRG